MWVGKAYSNDGYGINLSYDNGPWMATANWSRVADSNDSSVWNIGVAYKWDNVRVMLSYEKTKDEGYKAGGSSAYDLPFSNTSFAPTSSEQESWLLGLEWDIGPGQFDAAVQRVSLDDLRNVIDGTKPTYYGKTVGDSDIMKYSVDYTYNLSKRTSVYGQVAYTDWDNEGVNEYYGGSGQESTTAVQVGMTHKF